MMGAKKRWRRWSCTLRVITKRMGQYVQHVSHLLLLLALPELKMLLVLLLLLEVLVLHYQRRPHLLLLRLPHLHTPLRHVSRVLLEPRHCLQVMVCDWNDRTVFVLLVLDNPPGRVEDRDVESVSMETVKCCIPARPQRVLLHGALPQRLPIMTNLAIGHAKIQVFSPELLRVSVCEHPHVLRAAVLYGDAWFVLQPHLAFNLGKG